MSRDLRVGARMLRKAPGSAFISVLALACGIGLTALMFSILWGAILRGLPFERSEQLMVLSRANPSAGIEQMGVTLHDYADWRSQQRSFEDLAAVTTGTVNVSGDDRPERYSGAFMAAHTFSLLRVQPVLGRTFTAAEDRPGAPPAVLIGYRIWQDRFAGDPGVLGRTLRVNGEQGTVIGVMPEGFRFPLAHDVWLPLRLEPADTPRERSPGVRVFGRLRDGVGIDQAMLEFDGIARNIAREHPRANEGITAVIQPFVRDVIGDEPIRLLFTMLGAVFMVLLMACANVANLLMSRTALRIKEVAVRSALGASRSRIVAQFLVEAFLLALAGAAAGLVLAQVGIVLFNNAIAPTNPPFWIDIRIDAMAVLFVLGLALVATLASGTLPALQAARANIHDILKDEARGSSSFRIGRISRSLVVLDIALSVGLLAGAGLMIKSVTRLRSIDYGFPTQDVFTARVALPEVAYRDEASQVRFHDALLARLSALPGAAAVSLASSLPGLGSGRTNVSIEGVVYTEDRDRPLAARATVSPGFFETFAAPILEGRDFSTQDRDGSLPVAIVNGSFARRHFPDASPLGRRIRTGGADSDTSWLTIVGVVPDLYMSGPENEFPEGFYVPLAQNATRFVSIVARVRGEPTAHVGAFRDAVASADPDLPLYFVNTLEDAITESNWFFDVFGALFMVFGFVALLLAAVGLYGVMSFSVGQRTREMGVRLALGAVSRDVLALVMRQGFVQLAIGLVLGLALGLAVSRLLTFALFDVDPRDPAIFAAVSLVLALTAMLACYVPARRASRVDPMHALRQE